MKVTVPQGAFATKSDDWLSGFEAGVAAAQTEAAAICEREAGACIGDIVPGDEIGRLEANARAGALLTAAADIRGTPHVGKFEADYSNPSAKQLQQPTGAEELFARSKPKAD
jgi:hypothetical protein